MAHRYPRVAFTLVELLIVVACIAILLALLIPALSKARDLARTAECTSNMRQLYTGLTRYAIDYNGWIMWGTYSKSPNSGVLAGTPSWMNILFDVPTAKGWRSKKNYVGTLRVAYCPSQYPQEPKDAAGNPTAAFRGSYGINKQMFWAGTGPYYVINDGGPLNYYYNLMRTHQAADMYLFGDTQLNQYDFIYVNADLRHQKKSVNIAFHDGHIELVPSGKFVNNGPLTPGGYPWRCLN